MVGDESEGTAFAGRDHQPRLLVRGAAPLADRAGAGPEDVDRGQAPVCGAWTVYLKGSKRLGLEGEGGVAFQPACLPPQHCIFRPKYTLCQ